MLLQIGVQPVLKQIDDDTEWLRLVNHLLCDTGQRRAEGRDPGSGRSHVVMKSGNDLLLVHVDQKGGEFDDLLWR